jgi:chorismate mutase
MKTIEDLRLQIDKVDSEIISLVCTRQVLVKSLASLKRDSGLPIRNEEIESKKVKSAKAFASSLPIDPSLAVDVMRLLIAHSVLEQTK